jgi:protein TonB
MSDTSVETSSVAATFGHSAQKYSLSSDLARLSLPAEYRDQYRTLAWVNSICFLFLVIGIVGLKSPKVVVRQLSEVVDTVPVVYTPPEDQPKPDPQPEPDEPQPQDAPVEAPQVVTIVAAADSANVAFAVPVQGAVAIAPARYASAPPPQIAAPPRPTRFNPDATQGGTFPKPSYPGIALRNHYQGTVTIEIVVDTSGAVVSAKVSQTSGFPVLDEVALNVVKEKWRFPPGPARDYLWPCVFKIE